MAQTKIPIGQDWLLQRMAKLGFIVNDNGMCFGINKMAERAFFLGELNKFLGRMKLIASLPIENFSPEIFHSNAVALPRQTKIDILATFDGICLYNNPDRYSSIISAENTSQKNLAAERILAPDNPGKIFKNICNLYTRESLKRKLELIQQYITVPIAIEYTFDNHIITLAYSYSANLIDANIFELGYTSLFLDGVCLDVIVNRIILSTSSNSDDFSPEQFVLNVNIVTTNQYSEQFSNQWRTMLDAEEQAWNSIHSLNEQKTKIDPLGRSLCYELILQGKFLEAYDLIDSGADANYKSPKTNATLLEIAVFNYFSPEQSDYIYFEQLNLLIEKLLIHGANPNLLGVFKNSILNSSIMHLSEISDRNSNSFQNITKLVQLLLEYGAEPNIPISKNTTIYQFAKSHELYDICLVLLDYDANTSAKDSENEAAPSSSTRVYGNGI